jgi:hypothetical protein
LQIDPEYLKRHYASLSDEGLREIERDELVGVAQKLYDEERFRRAPSPILTSTNIADPKRHASRQSEETDDSQDPLPNVRLEPEPDWLSDAGCACSFATRANYFAASEAEHVRDVLDAAGIPVYLGAYTEDQSEPHIPVSEIRVMVPSRYTLQAESVLDREINNPQTEDLWKAHLATLSDEEFRGLDFEDLISGLTDRVERLRQAYKNERTARAAKE